MLVIMVVVGGTGRLWGAIVGTIVLMWLPEALRATSTWEPIAFGAVLALVMRAPLPAPARRPQRIALMGFSRGGQATLYASERKPA